MKQADTRVKLFEELQQVHNNNGGVAADDLSVCSNCIPATVQLLICCYTEDVEDARCCSDEQCDDDDNLLA